MTRENECTRIDRARESGQSKRNSGFGALKIFRKFWSEIKKRVQGFRGILCKYEIIIKEPKNRAPVFQIETINHEFRP